MALLLHQKPDIFVDSLKSLVLEKLNGNERQLKALDGLDLFSDEILVERHNTPLDALTAHLAGILQFETKERDLAIMRHDVTISWPDGTEVIYKKKRQMLF